MMRTLRTIWGKQEKKKRKPKKKKRKQQKEDSDDEEERIHEILMTLKPTKYIYF